MYITLDLISTDDEGAVYTCSVVGHYGSQEGNITLNVEGKTCDAMNDTW